MGFSNLTSADDRAGVQDTCAYKHIPITVPVHAAQQAKSANKLSFKRPFAEDPGHEKPDADA